MWITSHVRGVSCALSHTRVYLFHSLSLLLPRPLCGSSLIFYTHTHLYYMANASRAERGSQKFDMSKPRPLDTLRQGNKSKKKKKEETICNDLFFSLLFFLYTYIYCDSRARPTMAFHSVIRFNVSLSLVVVAELRR